MSPIVLNAQTWFDDFMKYSLQHLIAVMVIVTLCVSVYRLFVNVKKRRKYEVKLRDTLKKLRKSNQELIVTHGDLEKSLQEVYQSKIDIENNEEKYRLLFVNLGIAYALHEMILDDEGKPCDYRFKDVNKAFARALNLNIEDFINKKASEVFPGADLNPWIESFQTVLDSGEPCKFSRYSYFLKKHFDVHVFLAKKGHFAAIYEDVTLNVNARKILTEEKERNSFILQGTKAGTYDWDMITNKFTINKRWAEIVGYEIGEIEPINQMTWRKFLHPDDLRRADDMIFQLFNREIDYLDLELRQKHKNGHWVWIQSKGAVVKWDDLGNPMRFSGIHIDINEKKLAEERLVEQRDKYHVLSEMHEIINKELRITSAKLFEVNSRYEQVISAANIGTFERDIRTGRVLRNEVAAKMLGFSLNDLGENNDFWMSRIHPSDIGYFNKACSKDSGNSISSFDVTYRMRHKNESWIWVQCIGNVSLTDKNGVPIKISGITQDITQRKEAEFAVVESGKRFKNIFAKSKTVMLIIDPVTKLIVEANESAVKFYGYSATELEGMSIKKINKIDPDVMDKEMKNAMKESRNYFVFDHYLKSGETRNVEVYTSPITVNRKMLLHSIVIDVTKAFKAKYEIQQINQRFRGLEKIIHYKAESINDLLDFTLKECIEYTKSEIGAVYHYNNEKKVLLLNSLKNDMHLSVEKDNTFEYEVMDCLNMCIKNKGAIIINDPSGNYPFINGHNKGYYKSITIPVFENNDIVALFWLGSKTNVYSKFHAEQLSLLLETTWILVERQRLQSVVF